MAERVREAALALLARRSYSVGETVRRLLDKGFCPEEVGETVEWLIELDYLNDKKYAREYARSYAARGHGQNRIRRALLERALDESLIDRTLEELPEDGEAIDRYIVQLSVGRDLDDPKQRRRLIDALYRRGFVWEDIRRGLARISGEED